MLINHTQYSLKGLNGGEFQQLMSSLLPRINPDYKGLVNSGAVEGTAKTRKGKPDIWLKRNNDELFCFEITVDKKKTKLINDLKGCIELYQNEKHKTYICVVNYEPQYELIKPLQELCAENEIKFVLFHNNDIAEELDKLINQDLRNEFLNIPVEKSPMSQQTMSTNVNNSAIEFSTEIKKAQDLLKQIKPNQAREWALAIQQKIEENNNIEEKIELYRIISDSYLMDPSIQRDAIPWIERLINLTQDENDKKRRIALKLILESKNKEADNILNLLLENEIVNNNIIELKCNIFLNTKKYIKGIEFLDIHGIKFIKKDFWYANFYSACMDYSKAKNHAKKAYKNNGSFNNRRLLFDINIRYLDTQFASFKLNKDDFTLAKELLTEADSILQMIGNNLPFIKSDILTGKAALLRSLSRNTEAYEVICQAYGINNRNPNLLKIKMMLELLRDNYKSALEDIDLFQTIIPDDPMIRELKYEVLMRVNPSEFIKLIERDIEENNYNIDTELLMVEHLLHEERVSEAEKYLNDLKIKYNNDASLSVSEAAIFEKKQDTDNAIKVLENSMPNLKNKWKQAAISILCNLYISKNDKVFYQKAILQLKPIINIFMITPFLYQYVNCLYSLIQIEECYEILMSIRELHGEQKQYIQFEAGIYAYTQNFERAVLCYQFLIRNENKKMQKNIYRFNLVHCFFRLGKKEEALEILIQINDEQSTIDELYFLSRAYFSFGEQLKAINYAYNIYIRNPRNQEAAEFFIDIVLRVDINPSILSQEVFLAFQDCRDSFKEKFPDSKRFLEIPSPENPDAFKSYMINLLSGTKNRFMEVEKIYNELKLPVSFYSKELGRDFFDSWDYILKNPTMYIWGESGNLNEIEYESQIPKAIKICFIDFSAILILDYLGLLEKLHLYFDKIYIDQSIFDEIEQQIEKYEYSLKRTTSLISLSNENQIVVFDSDKNYLETNINHLKRILSLFKRSDSIFHRTGRISLKKLDSKVEDAIHSIENHEFQTIANAITSEIPLIATNSLLRSILKNNEINGLAYGIYVLLRTLLCAGHLTFTEYFEKLLCLIKVGYKHIPFNNELLMYCLRKNGFADCTENFKVLSSIEDETWNLQSIIEVTLKTLVQLWHENIPDELKEKWTKHIIERLKLRINIIDFCNNMIKSLKELIQSKWGKKKRERIINIFKKIITENSK